MPTPFDAVAPAFYAVALAFYAVAPTFYAVAPVFYAVAPARKSPGPEPGPVPAAGCGPHLVAVCVPGNGAVAHGPGRPGMASAGHGQTWSAPGPGPRPPLLTAARPFQYAARRTNPGNAVCPAYRVSWLVLVALSVSGLGP
ncbi:hypothetical protein GCM10010168_60700 [Actinoplanes ianthinogenes]|uniref:Uncharacterized protein n=1 Tax=Actinoplanes ianthinogenes TaxID=122358 RepID=A0ABN6CMV2_9ACTN|nr:hypothetical protein Aiant_70880 [Actinoplanes ianthinogenes]GGR34207.1 hypothetical protein GCM10010168_60700 [Actinoplanes ianthinogenes]